MAKDKVTSPEEVPKEPIEGATETEPKAETEFVIPEDLKGKTPEELARMYVETKEKVGKQGQDMGEKIKALEDQFESYRREADDQRRVYDMYSRPGTSGYTQPQPSPIAEDKPTFDYEQPFSSIENYLQKRESKMQQRAYQQQIQNVVTEGQYAYQQGRNLAYRDEPDLYRGIEKEVEQRMYQTYAPYAKNMGMSVKEYVGDPSIWRKCAQNVRLEREEFDYLKPKKLQPMTAVETEAPTSTKPAWGNIPGQFDLDVNDDDMRAWNKVMARHGIGTTPEKRKEILKKEQDKFLRGEQ